MLEKEQPIMIDLTKPELEPGQLPPLSTVRVHHIPPSLEPASTSPLRLHS
jgi:hypothetical protein